MYLLEALFDNTRELPPSAGFPSPSGGVAPSASPLGRLWRPFGQPPPSVAVKEKEIIWGGSLRRLRQR